MILGYIRISTHKQDLDNQRNAILHYANGHRIIVDQFFEVEMSSRRSRTERRIDDILSKLSDGDSLLITELSRLGRSITEIIGTVNELMSGGIRL